MKLVKGTRELCNLEGVSNITQRIMQLPNFDMFLHYIRQILYRSLNIMGTKAFES